MNGSDVATLVKQAVDIVDVIGQAVSLRRIGNRYLGLCPFHQEKTPSFQIDANNQLYYCFGCGSGGDVLSFVMKHQNLSFAEAVKHLAERYHVTLPETARGSSASGGAAEAARKEREKLHRTLQWAADYYARLLHSPEGETARAYLSRRALPDAVVETERLGYASSQWDGLLRQMKASGLDTELGIQAGLLSRSAKDPERLYDRFRNRLMFPITDDRGRVVAFGGRSLASDSQDEPKYLNSPETLVYQKGRMLYQQARAREACRQLRQVVLVEGYMDLLALHAHGFYRVVATLGTALTVQQIRLLTRMADEVILAYDGDEAGERAMLRALTLFLKEDMTVSCIRFPGGMDPDDFLKAQGLAGFDRLVRQREDLGRYAVRKALQGWDGSTSGKAQVLSEVKPILDTVRQPLLRSEYLRLLADRLSLSETLIQRQVRHGDRQSRRSNAPSYGRRASSRLSATQSLEENIVRVMVRYPELIEEVEHANALEHFQESRLKALAEALVQASHGLAGAVHAQALYELISDEELKELFARLLLESPDLQEPHLQLKDWLGALCRREINQRLPDLRDALSRAEQAGDSAQIKSILMQIQELSTIKKRVKDTSDNPRE